MYDKVADRFLSGTKSPKQLFYVTLGNAAAMKEGVNTIAETSYGQIDVRESEFVKEFLACPNVDGGIRKELHMYMNLFMVTLYFRVPSNDSKYSMLYHTGPSWARPFLELPQFTWMHLHHETAETMRKMSRAFLPTDLYIKLLEGRTGVEYHKVFDPGTGSLILSDNPVVYLQEPNTAEDLLGPCIVAVGQNRLALVDDNPGLLEPKQAATAYNVLAIEQANRIICASNMPVLRTMVQLWKELRKVGYLPALRNHSFRMMTEALPKGE